MSGSANGSIVVAHVDLDKFKQVNTDDGETKGDLVLAELAAGSESGLLMTGLVVRKGGRSSPCSCLTNLWTQPCKD